MTQDIIAIDGPTSSGKNSVGFLLAQKLGYQYIDTGMIYRAGSIKILKENISPNDLEKILEVFKDLDIKFQTEKDIWKMYLDSIDVTNQLHTPEISNLVHMIAAMPEVREIVKTLQKKVAQNGKAVVGGRDIGSEIFPDARYKFFLTASVEVRARRRFNQLAQKDPSTKFEDVLNDMKTRDEHDATREASPMRIPEGAVVVDNSHLTIEQTVDKMLEFIHQQS